MKLVVKSWNMSSIMQMLLSIFLKYLSFIRDGVYQHIQ